MVEQVRSALFRGELKSGDFLGSETELARKLGVSRVPIRDAFRTLQAMGIVEIRMGANGGARIAGGDPSRFADALAVQFKLVGISAEELFEAQIAVEGAAAELAAANANKDDLVALRESTRKLKTLLNEPAAFTEAGLQFHFRIVEASHNRALIAYGRALVEVLYETYAPQTTPELARRVLGKHVRILSLIEAKQGLMAREAMTAHLREVRRHVLEEIQSASTRVVVNFN
jgi:GntR family transcriptional regulator, transcriptional repressor for pyruvate dehydrogenase complex